MAIEILEYFHEVHDLIPGITQPIEFITPQYRCITDNGVYIRRDKPEKRYPLLIGHPLSDFMDEVTDTTLEEIL